MRVNDSKFVYSIKNNNGKPERRARLVERGDRDLTSTKEETTSTVATPKTVNIMIVEYLNDNGPETYIRNWDFTSAYQATPRFGLHFLKQHRLYKVEGKEDWVYQLNNCLNGAKGAGRGFQLYAHGLLMNEMNFNRSYPDPCFFRLQDGSSYIEICTIVDDYVVRGRGLELYGRILENHEKYFKVKDLGPLTNLLRMKFDIDPIAGHAFISQQDYSKSWLRKFGIDKMAPAGQPYQPETFKKLSKKMAPQTANEIEFMRTRTPMIRPILGCMQWGVVMTRFGEKATLHRLQQLANHAGKQYWHALMYYARYVNSTTEKGLHLYAKDWKIAAGVYCDSGLFTNPDTLRAKDARMEFWKENIVASKVGEQTLTAVSSTEAEFCTQFGGGKAIIALNRYGDFLGVETRPAVLMADCKPARQLALNPVKSKASNYYLAKLFRQREWIEAREYNVGECASKDMLADYQTKYSQSAAEYEASDAKVMHNPGNVFPDEIKMVSLDRLYGDTVFRILGKQQAKLLEGADTDSEHDEDAMMADVEFEDDSESDADESLMALSERMNQMSVQVDNLRAQLNAIQQQGERKFNTPPAYSHEDATPEAKLFSSSSNSADLEPIKLGLQSSSSSTQTVYRCGLRATIFHHAQCRRRTKHPGNYSQISITEARERGMRKPSSHAGCCRRQLDEGFPSPKTKTPNF
jgi:hypothetical protein